MEGTGVAFVTETNSGKARVDVSTNALPGPRWIRLFNDEGASEPRLFVVGSLAEIQETETNNAFTAAQSIPQVPATINGRLDKNGDVDSFAVAVRAGQWLEARLDAYDLMSRLDPVLRLVTTNGRPLAQNHDFLALDPRIAWQAPVDTTAVIQVFGFKYPADASIQLAGGEGAVYRLHLATQSASPDGPDPSPPGPDPQKPPVAVRGLIAADRQENRHRIQVSKDEPLTVAVAATSVGFPWDPWLRIEDGAGKVLAENDDSENSSDPRLDWRAPADGVYAVVVASRTHRGGPRNRYELDIRKPLPGYRATLSAASAVVKAGETNEIKVSITRQNGHTNDLRIAVASLPEGLTAEPTNAPPGNGEVSLRLIASTNAPAHAGPISVQLTEAASRESRSAVFDMVSRGENNGVPQGYSRLLLESIDTVWLTVRPVPPPASAAPAKEK